MCQIPNGYRIELFESPDVTQIDIYFARLDEQRSLQKQGGYTSRIAGSHFGCCCQHKET